MKFTERIKQIFAGRPKSIPERETVPNVNWLWQTPVKGQDAFRYQQFIPNEQQIRHFSKNSIVRRAISLIIDGVVKLPWEITTEDPNDEKDYTQEKLAFTNVIKYPNLVHDYEKFVRLILEDTLAGDCGCFEVKMGGNPLHPMYLYPVNGFSMGIVYPYEFNDINSARYSQRQANETKYFSASQIGYIQKNHFSDSPFGLGAVTAALIYIDYLLNTQDYANSVGSNAMSKFMVNIKGLQPDQLENYRTYIEEEIMGTNKTPIVSGESIESIQTASINDDAIFQGWQQLLIAILAISFNLPPEKLGIDKSNDRSTVAEKNDCLVEEAVKPYANLLASEFTRLGHQMGFYGLKFRYIYEQNEVQKKQKSDRIMQEFTDGLLTENEARVQLGYKKRKSKYSDITLPEAKAEINKDYNPNPGTSTGGYNGVGNVKDNGEQVKESKRNRAKTKARRVGEEVKQ